MGKRLTYANLQNEYKSLGQQKTRKRLFLRSLLQDDYGEAYDCTITSMACMFGEAHYNEIENIARRYGYDGASKGTNPVRIRKIMRDAARALGISGTPRSAYGKTIGWNYKTIQHLITNGIPVILNLWDDGRSYYHDHSVLIIGFEEYAHGRFLLIFDNWSFGVSLIDYNKLCVISSINWLEPGRMKG